MQSPCGDRKAPDEGADGGDASTAAPSAFLAASFEALCFRKRALQDGVRGF